MTLNLYADIDEQIQKLDELLVKYEQVEEHTKKLHFVTIKELAEMMRLFIKYSTSNFLFVGLSSHRFCQK